MPSSSWIFSSSEKSDWSDVPKQRGNSRLGVPLHELFIWISILHALWNHFRTETWITQYAYRHEMSQCFVRYQIVTKSTDNECVIYESLFYTKAVSAIFLAADAASPCMRCWIAAISSPISLSSTCFATAWNTRGVWIDQSTTQKTLRKGIEKRINHFNLSVLWHVPIVASTLWTSASINSNLFPTFSFASSKSTVSKIGPTNLKTLLLGASKSSS